MVIGLGIRYLGLMSVADLAEIEVTLDALAALEVDTFSVLLQKEITSMRLRKMSEEAIFQTLLADAETGGRLFGGLANGIKTNLYTTISDAAKAGGEQYYLEQGIDTRLRQWLVVSKNPCDDCLGRAGRIETLDYWETIGLPRSGFSVCKGKCQCEIPPAHLNPPDRVILGG